MFLQFFNRCFLKAVKFKYLQRKNLPRHCNVFFFFFLIIIWRLYVSTICGDRNKKRVVCTVTINPLLSRPSPLTLNDAKSWQAINWLFLPADPNLIWAHHLYCYRVRELTEILKIIIRYMSGFVTKIKSWSVNII